jgi:hypothetical protein
VAALDTSQWIAVLSVVAVVIGWFASSWLQSTRERKRRQDEMRVAFLAEAYERLALISNRSLTDEVARSIETAVAKYSLSEIPKAIKLVHRFLDEWAESEQKTGQGRASLDPLLFALRDSLRRELSLSKVRSPVRWLRPRGGIV